MKLTIERDRWDRGNRSGYLLGPNGKCCLGFLALACGYRAEEISGVQLPGRIRSFWRYPDRLSSSAMNDLMTINDNPHGSEAGREHTIARMFAEYGVEVEFVDTAQPIVKLPEAAVKIEAEDLVCV